MFFFYKDVEKRKQFTSHKNQPTGLTKIESEGNKSIN